MQTELPVTAAWQVWIRATTALPGPVAQAEAEVHAHLISLEHQTEQVAAALPAAGQHARLLAAEVHLPAEEQAVQVQDLAERVVLAAAAVPTGRTGPAAAAVADTQAAAAAPITVLAAAAVRITAAQAQPMFPAHSRVTGRW